MKTIVLSIVTTFFLAVAADAQKLHRIPCTTDLGAIRFKKVDTTAGRSVADNYKTWENGKVLLVKFMGGGSPMLRKMIQNSAKSWEAYGNVTLKFVADTARFTDLRINLGKGMGHNSAVGTDAADRAQNKQTINFDTLYFADAMYYVNKMKQRGVAGPFDYPMVFEEMAGDPGHWDAAELNRVVTHEFGHALGLLHEQSYPGAIHWNKSDSVYAYYEKTQGWDRDKVDFNVFEANNQFSTNGTSYDPKSIMHYSVEAWQTEDGYSLADNYVMSAGDKAIIAALYPKDQKVSSLEVPKVRIPTKAKLKVVADPIRKGLVVTPTFDLQTNSKLGHVYLAIKLVDEDGYYIPTENQFYNWGGYAASYVQLNLLPNSKMSYNKTKTNLQLFFPYAQMPDLASDKVLVEFSVVLDDEVNGQLNKVMSSSITNPVLLTKK